MLPASRVTTNIREMSDFAEYLTRPRLKILCSQSWGMFLEKGQRLLSEREREREAQGPSLMIAISSLDLTGSTLSQALLNISTVLISPCNFSSLECNVTNVFSETTTLSSHGLTLRFTDSIFSLVHFEWCLNRDRTLGRTILVHLAPGCQEETFYIACKFFI